MRKKFFTVALVCALTASMSLSSCIGSFGLTNKLLAWNQTINNKFVNELVFFAFLIVPVYEVAALADILVLNSIEFWSGTSPVAQGRTVIDGKDGKYLVDADAKGYTITRVADGTTTRLNYHDDSRVWTVVGRSGQEYNLVEFVDDTHVRVPAYDGQMRLVELNEQGLYAYQTTLMESALAAK